MSLEEALGLLATRATLLAALATLLAGIMRGYAGFGTAITLAPIYALVWGPRIGLPVMLVMEALIAGSLVPGVWRVWNRRVTLPMAATACLALPLGTVLLAATEPELLRRIIGGLVLGFAGLLAAGWRYHGARPLALNLGVGVLSGLLKGATGMAGPPVILYLLSGAEAAREHRANLIVFFGIVSLAAIPPLLWYGLLSWQVALLTAAMLPALLVGLRIGIRLFGRLPEAWFRRVAYLFVGTVGLVALLG